LLGKAKTNIAVSWIEDWLENSDEKIVVFAYHRSVVEVIAEKLGKVCVKYYGGMSEKEKEASKDAFINNPDVRVIVMNIDTCTGVDGLNKVARTCFYAENTGLPGLFDQSEGRVRRINSTYDAYFTYILKADVLDDAILDVMWERKKLFDSIMTGKETEVNMEDEAVDVIRKLKGE
jgi:superfamily II DNA or RNA helicase